MSKIKVLVFSLIVLGIFVICFMNNEKLLCPGGNGTIECAYRHPSIISLDSFQHYSILDSALDQILLDPCRDLNFTSSALGVGLGFYPNHAHYSEEMTETIDKMSNSSPDCFLKAAVNLDQTSKTKVRVILKALSKDLNIP